MTDALDIPAFLRRERDGKPGRKTRHAAKKAKSRATRRPKIAVRLPRAGRWRLFDVHFADHAPSIGCGMRRVHAAVGHKWVKLVSEDGRKRARVLRSVWDGLRAVQIED